MAFNLLSSITSLYTRGDGYTRIRIPYLTDIVIVSKPDFLRQLATHEDVARPDQGILPWPFSWLVRGTQFFAPRTTGAHYAVAFTTTDYTEQKLRRFRVFENLLECFDKGDIEELKKIVHGTEDRKEAAIKITQVVGPNVLGYSGCKHIPDHVIRNIGAMKLTSLIWPWKYFRARLAREKIMKWIQEECKDESHHVDVLHDIVTLYHGFTAGLIGLRRCKEQGGDVVKHLVNNPILPISIRVPKVDTNVNGAFEKDLVRGKTTIIMNNGAAARESQNLDFVFGMGVPERQCPFRRLFLDTGYTVLRANSSPNVEHVRSLGET